MDQYLTLIEDVAKNGNYKPNRTAFDTISKFSHSYTIDLNDGFPLVTTKNMAGYRWNSLIHELLWYLSGEAHIRNLREETSIWDEWADENGGLDTSYARFWRRFPLPKENQRETENGETWTPSDSKYINKDGTFDQIEYVLDMLSNKPYSRRIVLTAWHPANAAASKLAPCHFSCVFNVQNGELNTLLTQRSGDIALGIPFNIASYAILTHLLAQEAGLEVGKFTHQIADAHIYCGDGKRGRWYGNNLDTIQSKLSTEPLDEVREFILENAPNPETDHSDHLPNLLTQLTRDPLQKPSLEITAESIDNLTASDITLNNYESHPGLKFGVAE